MIIYRYREATSFNIKALLDENINGSLFKLFNDFTELNFEITEKTLIRFEIDRQGKEKIISLLKNHIMDKYYMACFTFNDPFLTNNMWRKYTNEGHGYCLAYETTDLESNIREQHFGALSMRLVNYNSQPYLIDELIEHILSNDGVRKELENDNIDGAVSKDINRISKIVMEMFVNKHDSCIGEREYRMILRNDEKSSEPRNEKMLRVKPKFIVVSESVCHFIKLIILHYSNKNAIPCLIINNPCMGKEYKLCGTTMIKQNY